ncbi:MAG: N-acetylmuramoyl-L-alanine amidase [Clostridia bacterium]|nr:N-acetylmuramoyl-L-alanine amidase [Clostridia bacterium]
MQLPARFKRKFFALFCACLFVAFLFGVWVVKGVEKANSKVHFYPFTVVIDAGHGGIDGGVSGKNSKVKESDLNLDIAKKLKKEFEKTGVKVVMTRSSFGGLYGTTAKGFKKRDLQKRIEIINGANADLMISLHLNYFSSQQCRGATTFYKDGDEKSKRLAQAVQTQLNSSSGQTRNLSALKGDYFILNQANCPAVICECGFLSNDEEEKLLLLDEYRQELAILIFKGATAYLLS